MKVHKTILALKLEPHHLTALDVARNAQEIIPAREQAALHFFCKGLGITDCLPEVVASEVLKTNRRK